MIDLSRRTIEYHGNLANDIAHVWNIDVPNTGQRLIALGIHGIPKCRTSRINRFKFAKERPIWSCSSSESLGETRPRAPNMSTTIGLSYALRALESIFQELLRLSNEAFYGSSR